MDFIVLPVLFLYLLCNLIHMPEVCRSIILPTHFFRFLNRPGLPSPHFYQRPNGILFLTVLPMPLPSGYSFYSLYTHQKSFHHPLNFLPKQTVRRLCFIFHGFNLWFPGCFLLSHFSAGEMVQQRSEKNDKGHHTYSHSYKEKHIFPVFFSVIGKHLLRCRIIDPAVSAITIAAGRRLIKFLTIFQFFHLTH